jgi:hypothetical protein
MSKKGEDDPLLRIEMVLQELIVGQKEKLICLAQRMRPQITAEDLLQPQDFPELDLHPEFRYEEGVLVGFEAAITALRHTFSRA